MKLVITVAETAEWLRTSEEAVTKLADDGRIPAIRYGPDDPPVFRPEDVVAFVEHESGSSQPSGLFGGPFAFAPLDVRGVPVPPVPPQPPMPGEAPVAPSMVFAAANGEEQSYEYSFSTDEASEAEALRRERDELAAKLDEESLEAEVEELRDELRRLREKRDR